MDAPQFRGCLTIDFNSYYSWYILKPLLKEDKIWDHTALILPHKFLRDDRLLRSFLVEFTPIALV